ncbi:MAG: hypothetical protein ABEK12_01785 [Candidatus Nanohaloarchaea archaeon]
MSPVSRWMQVARQVGLFRYILPFLLTVIVVYGVLERVSPFGGGQQRIHLVLAGIIGLFVTAFSPAGTNLGVLLSNFFGAISVVLLGIVGAMVVGGLVFGEDFQDSAWSTGLAGIGVLAVITIFLAWGGLAAVLPAGSTAPAVPTYPVQNLFGIAVVVGGAVFLYWALGGESGPNPDDQQ